MVALGEERQGLELELLDGSLTVQLAQPVLEIDASLRSLVVLDRYLALQRLHQKTGFALVEAQDRLSGRHRVTRLMEGLENPRRSWAGDDEFVFREHQARCGDGGVDGAALDDGGAQLNSGDGRRHPAGKDDGDGE